MEEIGAILEADTNLSGRFTRIVSGSMPAVKELITQGSATMQSANIVDVHDFLLDLQAQAGPKLRMDIDFILRGMESGWLLGWSGITVEEAEAES